MFGYLLSVFRMKYGGYPYRYVLFMNPRIAKLGVGTVLALVNDEQHS